MKYQLSPDEIKVVRDVIARAEVEHTGTKHQTFPARKAEEHLLPKIQRIFSRADSITLEGNIT